MVVATKEKNINRKPSPITGTVAAKPTEGVSVSRHVRIEIMRIKYTKMILICVRTHAPIASQPQHFPAKGKASHYVFVSLRS